MARSTRLVILIKNIYILYEDMAKSTRLVILIKNIYTSWSRKRLFLRYKVFIESSILFYSTSNGLNSRLSYFYTLAEGIMISVRSLQRCEGDVLLKSIMCHCCGEFNLGNNHFAACISPSLRGTDYQSRLSTKAFTLV